jgi:hypothetical protein
MYIFISFYKNLSDKVGRKAIHIVDNPKTMFETLNKGIEKTEWTFYAYQVDCSTEHLTELYIDFYSKDKPPVIIEGVMYGCRYKYRVVEQSF